MKRRQVITRAGAAALSGTLAACGVGSDPADSNSAISPKELGDPAAGKNPASDEIAGKAGVGVNALNLIPTYLVKHTGQYQVEVTFNTTRACSVDLGSVHDGRLEIIKKEVTNHLTHKVGFALYSARNAEVAVGSLYFNELAAGTYPLQTTTVGGSAPGDDSDFWRSPNANYEIAFMDGAWVYSWTFYSKNDGARLGFVRFYQIPDDERSPLIGVAAGRFILPIVNNATANDNPFGSYPKLHDDTTQATGRRLGGSNDYTNLHGVEASTLADPTGKNKDCVILPDTHVWGVEGIVPTYLAASKKLRSLLRRRMLRHADNHSTTLASKGIVIDDSPDIDVHHLVGNEVLRLLGGAALIQKFDDVKKEAQAEVEDKINEDGSEFHDFCRDNLYAAYYREETQAQAAALRAKAETTESDGSTPRPEEPVTDDRVRQSGGGLSCTVALQLGGSFSYQPNPLFGAITRTPFTMGGAGFRLSLGLAKASVKWIQGGVRDSNTTSIADHTNKGFKVGFTFIIKCAAVGNLSGDIEVTFGMTFKGNGQGHRLDFIQIDPVFDIGTHNFVNKLIRKFMAGLMQQVARIPISANLNISSTAITPCSSGVFASTANMWSVAQAGVPLVKDAAKKVLNLIAARTGATRKDIDVLEFSPLRFYAFNQNVNNTSEPFKPGGFIASGRPPVWAWQPGIKYIVGQALVVKTPASSAVQANGFMRVVAVLDGYYQRGTVEYLQASAHSWSYA